MPVSTLVSRYTAGVFRASKATATSLANPEAHSKRVNKVTNSLGTQHNVKEHLLTIWRLDYPDYLATPGEVQIIECLVYSFTSVKSATKSWLTSIGSCSTLSPYRRSHRQLPFPRQHTYNSDGFSPGLLSQNTHLQLAEERLQRPEAYCGISRCWRQNKRPLWVNSKTCTQQISWHHDWLQRSTALIKWSIQHSKGKPMASTCTKGVMS